MKKICVSFLILLLVFSTQAFAIEDWNKENKKREEAVKKSVAEFLEPYMDESTPENERIISYDHTGGGYDFSKEEEGIFKADAYFNVKPYSEEDTIWKLEHNLLFLEYSIVDGEYILEWASLTPKNYDKFLERFEEYQKNGQENVEIQSVQAEKIENLEASQIEKMSNTIFATSAIVLLIVIVGIIVKIVRKRK